MSSIGIFRAIDVRLAHAEFTASFNSLQSAFVANISQDIKKYLTREKVQYYDISLKPYFLNDPIYSLLRKTDFTPWLVFDRERLPTITAKIDIYEIYEPYFFYSSQIANLAKKNNKPLITEIWTSFPTHPSVYIPPYSRNVKNVIEKTDLFVFRSKKAQQYLESFHIPENKKVVLYHGVNLNRFYPGKDKNSETIKILFVGALAVHKGLDDLLAVFPELVAKYPNKLELIICGEGPLCNHVIQLAKTAPIKYLGKVSNVDLPEIYRKSHIYCQPSKDYYFLGIKGGEEFAGYTFMEALASGLPIVSTHCGGIPEIVGNENTLVGQGMRQELYAALDRYIANKTLRKEIGIKNRKRAEELFDLFKQTKILEKVITARLL